MSKRQPANRANAAEKRRREGPTKTEGDVSMPAVAEAEHTQTMQLTTETVLETYDVQMEGANCVHECVRPAELAGQGKAQPPVTPAKTYPFQLDVFQQEAVNCLENKESVMVAAHTSAGKTVVAEYAIAMALRDKQRIIYTSPIKALSNQKYRDLQDEFKDVGLMTGDVTINPHASCMIMTTEILRSMLYRGSDVSREMAWVVFDEVHYMRDRDRGVVWEEAMILLPDSVRLVFLSATIPNAREFAEWICRIKHQPCHVIYTDKRPVPLQHYLFPSGGDGVYMVVDEKLGKGQFREDNFHKAVGALQQAADAQNVETKKKLAKRGKSNLGDLEKIVRMCSDRGYLPLIVFSFSRKECEANAVALKRMDVTDDDEKKLIDEVFNNAIMTLGDEDRELPQVQSMLPLLRRGLGIHHGGLLPMLKEVVEILFQESLIKVLFSTETFAMGINMPAKTVVFTNTRKWDGIEYRILHAGEYIQMSGRAGRRGKDDRGLTIIMFDEKVEPEVAKEMFLGQSSKIFSAFHLGYNMLINLLRLEGADPDYMIQRSFHQFQKDKGALELQSKKQDLETELNNLEDIRAAVSDDAVYSFNVDEAIADYYYIDKQLKKKQEEKREIVVRPENIAPFLNPGRLVYMRDGDTDWGWGILVSASRKKLTGDNGNSVLEAEESEPQWVLDTFMPCEPGAEKPQPANGGKPEGKILPMALTLVSKISKIRSNMPTGENHKTFKLGIPELDPVVEMNIQSEEMNSVLSSLKDLESKLTANNFHKHDKLKQYYDCFSSKVRLHSQVQELDKQINQSRFMVMNDDLRAMRRVLRRLEFIDKDGVVQLKGRMACEITSCDEVLMTEIVFQNVFADIDANNIIALCSCLVFDEKSEDPITNNLDLMKAFETCKGIARNVAEVMVENKIPLDVEEYVQKLKPQLMEVVLGWLEGKRFHEIMNQCNLYEGSVVRVIRRLEELVRELATAAKTIGNDELAQKLNEGRNRLKRGIIFAAAPSASCPTSVVNGSMPGRYEYSAVEEDLYRWWEAAGFFRPEVAEEVPQASEGDRESYVVPMPPPNVTGRLHMGHAMFVSLEDVLTRFHRMRGDRTLWLPGTDHAGIATQMLVERQLTAEGSSRQEVGREEFLRRVWEWKDEKGGAIVNQLRRLGASADWSREQFTLNDHMSSAVIEAFCRLHEKGAIFRGQRMVNWSPVLQTAVSDLEVEYSDVQGHLYHFKYMVADTEEFIPVATTRPETILGDTAVCVHPEDPRYEHLIGKDVIVPIQGRRIPVIADAYVDREFGTGALKITPAHDFNDFEIGQTHKLESHSVIGLDGSMSPTLEALGSPQYIGLDRADCRKKLWADLEEAGLTLKVEDHMQRVPLSQRSGEVIEPMLSDQWFVSTEVMAQRAMDAVESGDITIQPDRFVKTWQGWLKEKQPWCISRQLWWGHRIPVYYPTNQPGSDKYFVARSKEEAVVDPDISAARPQERMG
ncbi:MTREX [Symbiodinium sp. KB8]|nr:MTREX [Symbiodinium sp. KB8]